MICGVFVWFSRQPLWPTDLWDHINYGEHLLTSGEYAGTEPLLSHVNTRMKWTDWGAKAIMAAIASAPEDGLPWLQIFHASVVAAWAGVITFGVFNTRGSAVAAMAACLALIALNWQQIQIIRPQTMGLLLFAIVAIRVTQTSRSALGRNVVLLPAVFFLWANLHGSFAVGLTLLGLTVCGRCLRASYNLGSMNKVPAGPRTQLQLLALVASIAACTLNPAGPWVFADVLSIGRHPNMQFMFEWDALSLQMKQGKVFATFWVILIPIIWFSPRRTSVDRIIWLLFFGGLTLWSARMINWFSCVFAIVLAEHAAAILRRKVPPIPQFHRRTAVWSVAAVVALLVAVMASGPFVNRRSGNPYAFVAGRTPVGLTEHLVEEDLLKNSRVFAPAEWSGYLMRHRGDLQPLAHLHVHLIPPLIWADQLSIHYARSDWQAAVDRNHLTAFIVDRRRNKRLIAKLAKDRRANLIWKNHQAAVFDWDSAAE